MSVTLNLSPEIEAGLLAQAQATGMTLERYVQRLVEKDLSSQTIDTAAVEPGGGMVSENGLLVYRTGRPLPVHEIDDAINRVRTERTQHILGNLS